MAWAEDLPEKGVFRGQVGTVVEELTGPQGAPACLVQFSDDDGRTYAMLPLLTHQLFVLRYEPFEPQVAQSTWLVGQGGDVDKAIFSVGL